jgi:transposase-like protein
VQEQYANTEQVSQVAVESKQTLEEILREGARRLLQQAIEHEVAEYITCHRDQRDERGQRLVVRNGSLPERTITTGIGPVAVKQPRVNDKRKDQRFTSSILPPYLRRVPSVDNLIPVLYLKGISTGDFAEALAAILGEQARGLSATNIVRLKATWTEDYQRWTSRDLQGKRYVYWWADGVYFNVRLEDDRVCMLVIIGALEDGTKELVAVYAGYRESKVSWQEALQDLKQRGLTRAPKLAVGDGALGFWAALAEEFPQVKQQQCWVHKTANVLDKLPERIQPEAKTLLHEMYLSPTKAAASAAYDEFQSRYGGRFERACTCLARDRDVLFSFYDFPAEHWVHIRTTNPIESPLATVRLRTNRTKGCGTRETTLTMVFKLIQDASKHWRRINGVNWIETVMKDTKFVDGQLSEAA